MRGLRVAVGAVPFVMILVGVFLPAINGPHLWFGLPSLMIWIALCTVVCTGVMLSYETLLRSAR